MIAVQELARCAVGDSDLPQLPAKADRLPFKSAQIDRLARLDLHIRLREFAQDARRNGMKRVLPGRTAGMSKRPSSVPRAQNS